MKLKAKEHYHRVVPTSIGSGQRDEYGDLGT